MTFYISLKDKEISCEYICKNIQRMIQNYKNSTENMSLSNALLKINLQQISFENSIEEKFYIEKKDD